MIPSKLIHGMITQIKNSDYTDRFPVVGNL